MLVRLCGTGKELTYLEMRIFSEHFGVLKFVIFSYILGKKERGKSINSWVIYL